MTLSESSANKNGIKLIEVWESDFNNEKEAIVEMLSDELK